MNNIQIDTYPKLIAFIINSDHIINGYKVDHKDDSNRILNQLPYNKKIWKEFIRVDLLKHTHEQNLKNIINNVQEPKEIKDFRILSMIEKHRKNILSKEKLELYIGKVSHLTNRGSKREYAIKKHLEEIHNKKFTNVSSTEDKSGIDLKDYTGLTYQIKSTNKNQIVHYENKKYLKIIGNIDFSLNNNIDILIVNETHHMYIFNMKRDYVKKIQKVENDVTLIFYNKIYYDYLKNPM